MGAQLKERMGQVVPKLVMLPTRLSADQWYWKMDSFRIYFVCPPRIECCVGQDVLQKGTVEGILMGNVTLKVLTEKKRGDSIIWYFRVGERWNNIATLRQTEWEISDLYKGRASIDTSNGYLTLSSLRCEDSGDYSVSVIRDVVLTGEISLRVRGLTKNMPAVPYSNYSDKDFLEASMNGSTPSSAQPGTTQGFSAVHQPASEARSL
ncbi:unnamed protein product [Menidia menidia]|uniref:(Atlantic silverside) hypothetical protein n=1 Tax=Menidia menidia TaxID=238744 RepID=A0A8S4AKV1_9TELE|nr:unnamed protein product [Menidia menidia]